MLVLLGLALIVSSLFGFLWTSFNFLLWQARLADILTDFLQLENIACRKSFFYSFVFRVLFEAECGALRDSPFDRSESWCCWRKFIFECKHISIFERIFLSEIRPARVGLGEGSCGGGTYPSNAVRIVLVWEIALMNEGFRYVCTMCCPSSWTKWS